MYFDGFICWQLHLKTFRLSSQKLLQLRAVVNDWEPSQTQCETPETHSHLRQWLPPLWCSLSSWWSAPKERLGTDSAPPPTHPHMHTLKFAYPNGSTEPFHHSSFTSHCIMSYNVMMMSLKSVWLKQIQQIPKMCATQNQNTLPWWQSMTHVLSPWWWTGFWVRKLMWTWNTQTQH